MSFLFVIHPRVPKIDTRHQNSPILLNFINELSFSSSFAELDKSIVGGDILSYQNQSARLEVSVANVKAVKSTARA